MIIGFHNITRSHANNISLLVNMIKDPRFEAITIGRPDAKLVYFQIVAPEVELEVDNFCIRIQLENEKEVCNLHIDRTEYERIEIIN